MGRLDLAFLSERDKKKRVFVKNFGGGDPRRPCDNVENGPLV